MRRIGLLLALVAGLHAAHARAQVATTEAAPEPAPLLETVVVSGQQPGPGLWKVSRDGHALWILGTVTPLPKRMQWISRDVDAVLAQAREVVWAPSFEVTADVGFFRGLLLAPKALGARRNPDGLTLQQVVPAEMYARWLPLKRKYIGGDRGVEQWRPLFAADRLYEAAIDDADLVRGAVVSPVVKKAIRAYGLKDTRPTYKLVIGDPKAALDEFRQVRLDDQACFGKTLDHLETDVSAMRLRANAWAIGDVEALRALPLSDQGEACMNAAMQSGVVRKRSQVDIDAELRRRWLDAARAALQANDTTFALLPIRELLKPDGYLAALRAEGYLVEAPE